MDLKSKSCSIEGCNRNAHWTAKGARGWCGMHYQRWALYGDPLGRTKVQKICSVTNCDNIVRCCNLCSAHYQRLRTHGDPLGGGTAKGAALAWLYAHVDHPDSLECLIWPFATSRRGAPHIKTDGADIVATRLMCTLAHGEPPSDIHEAAHSCGKGHLSCIHPKHLAWKTPKQNAADKLIHDTHDRGERHPLSILTEPAVREIRRLRGVVPQKELAERYGVSISHVCEVQNLNEWKWLD